MAAPSRIDRQLMRQRGAGNRKINNINFGFSFPTPNQSRRSSRISQSARRSVERSSKTPDPSRGRKSSALNISGEIQEESQTLSYPRQGLSTTPQQARRAEQPNSGKRRRLNGTANDNDTHDTIPNIRSLDQRVQKSGFVLVEDDQPDASGGSEAVAARRTSISSETAQAQTQTAPSLLVGAHDDKENVNNQLSSTKSTTKRKKPRGSLIERTRNTQQSLSPVQSNTIIQSVETPRLVIQGEYGRDKDNPESVRQDQASNELNDTEPPVAVIDIERTKAKKKKRKSVVLRARKQRSSAGPKRNLSSTEPSSLGNDHNRGISHENQEHRADERSASNSESEVETSMEPNLPPWKKTVSRQKQGRRNRLSVSASPLPPTHDNEDADETYVDEEASPEPVTPAVTRKKPRGGATKKAAGANVGGRQENSSHRKSFPIVSYRIANLEALPTIAEEEEREDPSGNESDTLNVNFPKRKIPNAVDILAQICRETVQSSIEKLELNLNTAKDRSEAKQKRTALEAFGESLDQQLFDMSEAVEQRTTLEARLRKSKREKAELQARWTEVRRQRDELALRADNIRRENWDNEEENRHCFEISELARKTELGLAGSHSDENNDDLEFMLRHVAGKLSGTTGQGGILDRIRSFNSQLERVAASLERT